MPRIIKNSGKLAAPVVKELLKPDSEGRLRPDPVEINAALKRVVEQVNGAASRSVDCNLDQPLVLPATATGTWGEWVLSEALNIPATGAALTFEARCASGGVATFSPDADGGLAGKQRTATDQPRDLTLPLGDRRSLYYQSTTEVVVKPSFCEQLPAEGFETARRPHPNTPTVPTMATPTGHAPVTVAAATGGVTASITAGQALTLAIPAGTFDAAGTGAAEAAAAVGAHEGAFVHADIALNTAARHSHANKALLDTYAQTEANLADAVSKKHTQGTDQGLDTGGANEVTAAQAKTAYTHSQVTSGNPHSVTAAEIGASLEAYVGELVYNLKPVKNASVNVLDIFAKSSGSAPAAAHPIKIQIPDGNGTTLRTRAAAYASGTGQITLANGTAYWGRASANASAYTAYLYAIWDANGGIVWALGRHPGLKNVSTTATATDADYLLLEDSTSYAKAATDYCVAVGIVTYEYDTADTPDYTLSAVMRVEYAPDDLPTTYIEVNTAAATQTINNNSWTKVTQWDTLIKDADNEWDAANSQVSFRRIGKYKITAHVFWDANATGGRGLAYTIGGTKIDKIMHQGCGSNNGQTLEATVDVTAVPTLLTIEAFQNRGGTLNLISSAALMTPSFKVIGLRG